MCFCKTRQSKVLRAKRDIVVYKIGAYADKYTFVPYYVNNYTLILFAELSYGLLKENL